MLHSLLWRIIVTTIPAEWPRRGFASLGDESHKKVVQNSTSVAYPESIILRAKLTTRNEHAGVVVEIDRRK